jgi:CMP-N,N'-diacetyllegionaminic acid synthase
MGMWLRFECASQGDFMTDLLAIIPARAGSKGVPGKNRANIGGKLLIEYSIDAALVSRAVSGILVTTDDPVILEYCENREGVFVVARPDELSLDNSKTADVVSHAIKAWEAGGGASPQSILLAQPTTPLRSADDIDEAFKLFKKYERRSVVSACKVDGIRHPRVMYRMNPDSISATLYVSDNDDRLQRQDYEQLYQRNGAIYLFALDYFYRTGRLFSEDPVIYEMPWERSINIDGPGDLIIAKSLIESNHK